MAATPRPVACRSACAASATGRRCRPTTRSSSNRNGPPGARIGTTRQGIDGIDPHVAALFDDALDAMTAAGAMLVDLDAAGFASRRATASSSCSSTTSRSTCATTSRPAPVCRWPARRWLTRSRSTKRTRRGRCRTSAQEIFELADSLDISSPGCAAAGLRRHDVQRGARHRSGGGRHQRHRRRAQHISTIDAIATPTGTPAWTTDVINGDHFNFATSSLAAIVGYPDHQRADGERLRPAGRAQLHRHRVQRADPDRSAPASSTGHARIVPQLFPTLPLKNVNGVPLAHRRGRGGAPTHWHHHSM